MIDYKSAIEIAKNYYQQYGNMTLTKIFDSEDMWIIYAKQSEQPIFNSVAVSINKSNGEVSSFVLPSRKNFEILKSAKAIDYKEN